MKVLYMLTGVTLYVTNKEGRTIKLLSQKYKTSSSIQIKYLYIFRKSTYIMFNEWNITLLIEVILA